MSAIVDSRELSLVLLELLGVERLQVHQRFAGYDRDAIQQVLDTAQHLAVSRFQPIAAEADANEPHFVGGRVLMPEGIGQALAAYAEAGFFCAALSGDRLRPSGSLGRAYRRCRHFQLRQHRRRELRVSDDCRSKSAAFGIQGIDLVGRKIAGDSGRVMARFVNMMRDTAGEAARIEAINGEAVRFGEHLDLLSDTVARLLACRDVARRLANATILLDAFGYLVIGWMWFRQAIMAAKALASEPASDKERAFYKAKLISCRYFARYELRLAAACLQLSSKHASMRPKPCSGTNHSAEPVPLGAGSL